MKRLSPKDHIRRSKIAKRRWRKNLRRKNFFYAPDEKHLVDMPPEFSLSRAYEISISAIEMIKELGHRPSKKLKVIQIDFGKTTSVSAAAMLVLNSEIDRIMAIWQSRVRFVAYRLGQWRATVVARLDGFGFFDLIDVRLGINWPDEMLGAEISVVPMIACSRLDPRRVQRIRTHLERVAKIFEQGPQLYEAMIEATGNAIDHAYPVDGEYRYQPIADGSWWATAVFSAEKQHVSVVVFDQGVGIPATLHRWNLAEHVWALIGNVPGGSSLVKDDARMISAALEVSRSSKAAGTGRGQGLRDVVSPVDDYGTGRVRILSGAGGILYYPDKEVELFNLPKHIGGTLIEWSLPVNVATEAQADDQAY